jgi:hypothetical protein
MRHSVAYLSSGEADILSAGQEMLLHVKQSEFLYPRSLSPPLHLN